MRHLIVSDLHGNLQALEAVARDSAGRYDRALCCGDLIGYCGDPNPVIDWVRANCSAVVRGNHDRACTGQEDLDWFNPVARQAALWTQQSLTPENTDYVVGLPRGPLEVDGFELVHGTTFDEDEYVIGVDEAEHAFGYLQCRLAFFGHTHIQGGFIWNHSRVEIISRVASHCHRVLLEVDPECAYLINPGSVGQPRDGDPRAAYVIYDSDAGVVAYHRVEYDVAAAQRSIREAGLPPILADRLSAGR